MNDELVGVVGILLLLMMIGIRIPIGISMISTSFAGLWYLTDWGVAWGALGIIPYQFSTNWVLSSVPMFLLLGYIAYHAKLTEGLFRAAKLWLARVPGGLAVASVLGCGGFASVCGSSLACAAAMGKIAIPEMIKEKYQPELATGSIAAGGTVGALIPPSIVLIIYGVIAQTSVTKLFLGGVGVGMLTIIVYCVLIILRVRLNPSLAPMLSNKYTLGEKFYVLRDVWPIIMVMIGTLGGLFAGIFTPTEAGAVGAFLAACVGIWRKTLNLKKFRAAALETLSTTTAILIIGIGASLFQRFVVLSGVGDLLSKVIIDAELSLQWVLFLVVLLYLALGMFLEPIGAMLLTLPLLLPIMGNAGVNLVWFGVVVAKLLEVGMITPPVGMNVFVIKSVVGNNIKIGTIFKGVFWFVIADIFVIALIILWPDIIMFLPNALLD